VIVLGVDPGTAATGYGVVERAAIGPLRLVECGVIRPPAGRPHPERLAVIFDELTDLVARHRPDVVAVETVFVAHNARSALVLGQARGMALLAAARAGLEVAEYAPRMVKKAVVGTGDASKGQVQQMVARLLRLKTAPRPADAADGVAIALTHCLRSGRPMRRAVVG
jgi:crossover junction endodeoxyribonuclease RuvC